MIRILIFYPSRNLDSGSRGSKRHGVPDPQQWVFAKIYKNIFAPSLASPPGPWGRSARPSGCRFWCPPVAPADAQDRRDPRKKGTWWLCKKGNKLKVNFYGTSGYKKKILLWNAPNCRNLTALEKNKLRKTAKNSWTIHSPDFFRISMRKHSKSFNDFRNYHYFLVCW